MKKNYQSYSQIVNWDNIYLAYKKAAKGRYYRQDVLIFNTKLEENLLLIKKQLEEEKYHFGPYRKRIIHEPKRRVISIAPFSDRIVHHAICQVVEPFFDKGFIFDTYACRSNKGNQAAIKRLRHWLSGRRFIWAWQGDIYHYFSSIDQQILLGEIGRFFNDQKIIKLLDKVISSYTDEAGQQVGLPIGNLTSQLFANIYLNPLDHFIKRNLKQRYYIRYMDDLLILSNDQEQLRKSWLKIDDYLSNKLKLTLHSKKVQIVKIKNGFNFLGYRHFINYYRPKKETFKRFFQRIKKIVEVEKPEFIRIIMFWLAWKNYCQKAKFYFLTQRLIGVIKSKNHLLTSLK
jgi:hypothetical protein